MPEAPPPADATWSATLCPYCGVGCGLLVQTTGDRVVRGASRSSGMICGNVSFFVTVAFRRLP